MIDDYKYMYLYKPLYMDVYIKDCIDIWDFSLFGGGQGYQKPGFRFRCLNTSLSSESVYSLAFWIGMLLWFEAMMIALSLEILIFLGFMGYLDLQVGKKSNSIYHLSQEMMMQNGLSDVITMVGSSTHSLGVEFDRDVTLIFIVVIVQGFLSRFLVSLVLCFLVFVRV